VEPPPHQKRRAIRSAKGGRGRFAVKKLHYEGWKSNQREGAARTRVTAIQKFQNARGARVSLRHRPPERHARTRTGPLGMRETEEKTKGGGGGIEWGGSAARRTSRGEAKIGTNTQKKSDVGIRLISSRTRHPEEKRTMRGLL